MKRHTKLEEAMACCDRSAILDREPYVVIENGPDFLVLAECEKDESIGHIYRYPEGSRMLVGE